MPSNPSKNATFATEALAPIFFLVDIHSVLDQVNSLEIEGHKFEVIKLERAGEHWFAQFAIDGKKYQPFYEPASNVHGMREPEFLRHMMAQSLTMIQYQEES